MYDQSYREICAYVISRIRNPDGAHDVIQSSYLSFYDRIIKHGMIPDNEATAYLKTCAKHEMGHKYGELNRSKRNISLDDETLDPQAAAFLADTSAEESALDRITLDEIWETISKLDAITYRIFIMRYSAEIPIADIANTLGMSYGNVCNRIYRTVKILSKKYSNSAPLKDECVSERKACIID